MLPLDLSHIQMLSIICKDVVLAQKKSLFTDGSVDHSTEEETGKEIKDGSQMI